MLIDTNITIAYKCTSCGSFEFFNISLFRLFYKKFYRLSCRCKKSCIIIKQEGENSLLVNIPCIGCGNEHTCLLSNKSVLLNNPGIFNCPEIGMQICFIGRDEVVRKKVDCIEEELDELIDMYGYESYFQNTQVMFDMLNHIHDIALKGNLYCKCGSAKIELVLLSDCILLICEKCGCNIKIHAAKNKDLKDLLMMSQILITENNYQYDVKNRKNLLSKHSGEKIGK